MNQMNQMSGTTPGGMPVSVKAPAGRAILLLAIATVLGIVLLHALDTSSGTTPSTASGTHAGQQSSLSGSGSSSNAVTSTTAPVRSPGDVKVLAANGAAVAGAAAKVDSRLQPIGYQFAKPTNLVNTAKQASSLVEYVPGYQAEAQALATSLGLSSQVVLPLPTPAPVADLQNSNIVVIVGSDLASAATNTQTTSASPTQGSVATTSTTLSPALNGPLTSQAPSGATSATSAGPTTTPSH